MPKRAYEIPINEETSEEDLQRCIIEATRTSDSNVVRAAANAQAELTRRDREEWRKRFELESRERVNAQQFQAAQLEKQLEVTEKQASSADKAMRAAWAAAIAAFALVAISTISLFTN